MTTATQTIYSDEQVCAWLRGLLTIAWADGHFDPEEKQLIANLTQDELAPATDLASLDKTITPEELAKTLGNDPDTGENFLRTAVMMALANGVYSKEEADVVNSFREALGLEVEALEYLEQTLYDLEKIEAESSQSSATASPLTPPQPTSDILDPMREWLDGVDVKDPRLARFICKMVPSQCPFERDVTLFGRKIVHIPAMCKINPLYEQLVGLRFRSLSYLADDCGEDVSSYL